MDKEYGLLYYDVSSKEILLYYKLKRIIDKCALPVNKSVYIFDWGLKTTLENKLTQIGAFSKASVSLVKFDNTSKEQLEQLALVQLDRMFKEFKERIGKTISKLHDIEKRKEYLQRTERKLKNYERLLVLYEFTKRAEPALDVLKKIISEEWKLCQGQSTK